jgi:hypothetical protein
VNGLSRGGNKTQKLDQNRVRYHKLGGAIEEFFLNQQMPEQTPLKSPPIQHTLTETCLAEEIPFREVLLLATDIGVLPSRENRDPVVDPQQRHIDP